MKITPKETLLLYIACIFVTCLLLGNLIAGKASSVSLGGFEFLVSMGEIPFPVTFVLTDLLNEFYGRRIARRITLIGFLMTVMAFGMIHLAGAIPWAPDAYSGEWKGLAPQSFSDVFTSATKIQIASMVAYLTAQFLDISIFHALRNATHGRHLWLRATGSTIVSQLIDTVVVTSLAWGSILSTSQLTSMIASHYVVKVTVAIFMTPAIYALHAFIEHRLQMKVLDSKDEGSPP